MTAGHADHFLSRLDRVSAAHVELALALYRDPELLRELLRRASVAERAERVAIAIGDDARGPFVVVTREGRFVTCLGEGMSPGATPVLPRAHLDGVARRLGELRARVAAAERLESELGARLLARVVDAGAGLTREEFVGISAIQPLVLDWLWVSLAGCLREVAERYAAVERMTRAPREGDRDALHAYWRLAWATGHLTALVAIDDSRALLDAPRPEIVSLRERLARFTSFLGYSPIALRGVWAVAHIGKLLLPSRKRALAAATTRPDVLDAAIDLIALGVRHSRLRAEVRKTLAPPAPGATPEAAAAAALRRATLASLQPLVDRALGDPDALLASLRAEGAAWVVAHAAQLGAADAPRAWTAEDDVPEELHAALGARVPADYLNDDAGRSRYVAQVVWAARARAEELYLPADVARSLEVPWEPAHTRELVDAASRARPPVAAPAPAREPGAPAAPARAAKAPSRNAPCPCGSWRKHKRCCGAP